MFPATCVQWQMLEPWNLDVARASTQHASQDDLELAYWLKREHLEHVEKERLVETDPVKHH